ncbi:uncharacterized protein LOC123723112 [Papilio machaon]|uniref:uncharacterized protein LOC123723112 n=1 Tax=Papilio machaon TaxID=76193 RepID=UPI001E663E44|nr:uncharacterized protein LOC123723112 [Papilio machaon]
MNKNSTNEWTGMEWTSIYTWITCRSKSHHRRIYYYNTVTGEAIWNLTDFENDKYKKTTKESVDARDHSDSYPEPKEPPRDICRKIFISESNEQNKHTDYTSTTFNECTINEPYLEHNLSHNSKVQRCDNINQMNDFMLGVPMAPTSTPNSSLSLINQPQVRIELDHNNVEEFKNNYVHTTSMPLSKRFQITKYIDPIRFVMPGEEEKSTALEVSEIDTVTQEEIDPLPSKYQQLIVARDLRQIISLKRQSNVTNNIGQQIDCNRTKINSSTIETLGINNFEEYQTDNINQKLFTLNLVKGENAISNR